VSARCLCGHDEDLHDVMCLAPVDDACEDEACEFPDICHCTLFSVEARTA
jgi:hypothetical protein